MPDIAVDLSNYTRPTPLTIGDVHCWMANGVTLGVVQAVQGGGRYPPGETPHQLAICSVAGLPTDGYILPFDGDSRDNLRAKKSLTTGYKLGRWWFDLEEPMSLEYVRFVLAEMDTWPAEKPVGIYTAYWYMRNQGWLGVTEFSDRALWLMQRDTDRGLPFSGWTEWTMRQYWLDATLCGKAGIDLSYIAPAPTSTQEIPVAIHVGDGIAAQMAAAGDRPLFGHRWLDETDDDGLAYKVETCYGTKGLYVSSNVDGPDTWTNAGPMGC